MSVDVLNNILNIEYSRLPGAAGNSELHFKLAAESGFDGLKADMRLTKDGEIILCHDPGYTFDHSHRITGFNRSDYHEIHDMTLAQVLSLEFDTPDASGNYYHPCTLDTMLSICKEYRMIPYLTNRHEDWRMETACRMAELLRKYQLEDHCIMNLYAGDPDTLKAISTYLNDPVACDTKHDYDEFSEEMIRASSEAGYQIICLCHKSKAPVTKKLIDYANEHGVSIWEWGMTEKEDVQHYLDLGIRGFQMYTREIPNSMLREMGY